MTAVDVKPRKTDDAPVKADTSRGQNVSGRNWKKVTTKRTSSLRKTAYNNQVKSSVATLDNAATTATSLALASQQQWPYVVIPDYAERTSGLRDCARFRRRFGPKIASGSDVLVVFGMKRVRDR